MAMLAEPRRRQKWTINPRGKLWTEDQNKFGQKMLEKMGWSSGKGLGAKEQGMTEHVRVKFKDDQAGIGFNKDDYDKNWIENQSGFNDFLQQLQQENGVTAETADDDLKGLSGKSLEVKSESSRARVHYTKFTRGKDVNKYNKKDLANIFGKKDIHEKYIPVTEEQISEEVVADPIGTTDRRGGIVTIKGGNMNDYFKNKMFPISTAASSNNYRERCNSESESEQRVGFGFKISVSNEETNVESLETKVENDISLAECDTEQPKKDKKSKKMKKKMEKETNFVFDNPCLIDVNQIDESAEPEEKPIKSKKSKKVKSKENGTEKKTDFAFENPCLMDINQIDESVEEQQLDTPKSIKKSKKKHKKTEIQEESFDEKINEQNNDNGEANCNLAENQIEILESAKKSKKDKSKKKNVAEVVEVSANVEYAFDNPCLMDIKQIDNDIIDTPKSKKKGKDNKKEKKKNETLDKEESLENAQLEVIDISEETSTKKKEKSKNKKKKESKLNETVELSSDDSDPKNNYAFENPALMNVNKIDSESRSSVKRKSNQFEVIDLECETPKKKKKKEKKNDESVYAFENPCLMSVCEIDNENVQEPESSNEKRKSKKRKSNSCEFAFENPCLEDVNKIDEKEKKPKKNKTNKENISVVEIIDNSKNEELEEKNNFAFENPCLGDIQIIDNEARKSKKRKRSSGEMADSQIPEIDGKEKKMKKRKDKDESSINESKEENEGNCNGGEFEVSRKHFGLVNVGLDLTDETSGKKRVTFNDKVEYNTDVEKNKKPKTKLDKYEISVTRKNDNIHDKLVHTKKELKQFFFKNPVLQFAGSNINELRGYGH